MAAVEKTVSALVDQQLPDFIRADHPQFKRFLELYYTWLEDESKGNTVYHIMNVEKYRDIDETLDPFIRYFKQELLPYFPEKTALDLTKILKGAREFYLKKGSEESLKWLFRVLFAQEVEIYYPKQQILIASGGKWKLPQAFQLTLSPANQNVDANLLEKHKGVGSISKATCIIESANRTVDRTFGNEILELYVSNVDKEFTNGENLEISYTDENGVEQVFSEKIIGAISNIRVDSNIKTDPQQKRRGLSYNVGDPVVVFGGLSDSPEAKDAIAVVGNVSVGSIEGLGIIFPGYGYRIYSNTETIVYRSVGDDPNANLSTDIRLVATNESVNANSQNSFLEVVTVDRMPIEYLATVAINNPNYAVFTANNRNIAIVANNDGDIYVNNAEVYANGNSYETANFKGIIVTSNTGWTGANKTLVICNVSNTVPLSTAGFLVGVDKLMTRTGGIAFNVNSIALESINANVNSQLIQAFKYEGYNTGGITLFNIINGGYGFRSTPRIEISSYFDTYLSENYAYGTAGKRQFRQPMNVYGKIAHVYINNGGTGYANGDAITITGRGYGFSGYVNVNGTGSIVQTTIVNRGEGYYGPKTIGVTTSAGANAVLTAYEFGEGASVSVETGAIGRVRDVRMISRGFDYTTAPLVSFKIVDMVINGIDENDNLSEGERVWQGLTLETAVFQGIVKSYNRSTRTLRLFNYSGAAGIGFDATLPFTSEGGVAFSVDLLAKVAAPGEYPASVRSEGLPNPWFYGNGQAKGIAEFFNGLIKFNGFYLNTDGFLSSDKKLQDANVYHNYSYIIESEKSLSDYRDVVTDIAHPIGMSMLGRTIIKTELDDHVRTESSVSLISPTIDNSTVNVANSLANTVTGTLTQFTVDGSRANVGDILLLIDTIQPLRSQAKLITHVANNTSLNVESNFVYIGQGKLTTNSGNSVVSVSGNVNTVSDFVQTGDTLRFNVAVGNTFVAQTGTVTIYTTNTKVVGLGTAFNTELAANDLVLINSQVRQVVNISSATVMNVNAVFSANATSEAIGKLTTIVSGNVTANSGTQLTLDITLNTNANGVVYQVIPNYKTVQYDYKIITTTE